MKKKINLIDRHFAHGTCLGSGDLPLQPDHFEWDRSLSADSKYTFVTDPYMSRVRMGKPAVLLIVEPMSIDPETYMVVENHTCPFFDVILSHNKEFIKRLVEKGADARYYAFGGCWIKPEDRKDYKKSKFCSIIASNKTQTEGHRLRHVLIETIKNDQILKQSVDIFGRKCAPIEYKLEGLKDYAFHIVIENEFTDGWFTEKVVDPAMCGCNLIIIDNRYVRVYALNGTYASIPYSDMESIVRILNDIKKDYKKAKGKYERMDISTHNEYISVRSLYEKFTLPENWLYANYPDLFE